jgi:hypothetical protein
MICRTFESLPPGPLVRSGGPPGGKPPGGAWPDGSVFLSQPTVAKSAAKTAAHISLPHGNFIITITH